MNVARAVEPLRTTDPERVGRYTILGRLGSGGMGIVYLAEGPTGTVALKLVRPELGEDTEFRARFRREVQACFRVKSTSTAQLVDFDTDADQPWMATEYVEGMPLESLVSETDTFNSAQLKDLTVGLADALAAIHAAGLVHRDLKPSNVICTDDGIKVIDFGIAAAEDAKRLTATQNLIGTVGWLAPEQVTDGYVGPETDIFALGLVIGFAATGRLPFGRGTAPTVIYRNANTSPDVDPESLPPAVRQIFEQCTDRDPAARPTALELREMLEGPSTRLVDRPPAPRREGQSLPPTTRSTKAVAATKTVPAEPDAEPAHHHRKRWIIAGVAAAVVAAGVTTGLVLGLGGGNSATSTVPPPGTYRGKTGQQLPITFTVHKNQVSNVNFMEKVTCTVSGQITVLFAGLPTTTGPVAANGVFSINVQLPEQKFRMVGEYANGQFTGGYRHQYNSDPRGHPTLGTPTQTCDSNQVTFAVRR